MGALHYVLFSQFRLANVRIAFVRSEPRPGAALASIVPAETSRDGALSSWEREGAKNRLYMCTDPRWVRADTPGTVSILVNHQ